MVIAAPQVLLPGGLVADATVAVAGGRIVAANERPDVVLPEGVLAPGLIDLQVNGCFGVDFARDEDWSTAVRRLPETGVTAFLPTLITAPLEDLVAVLRHVPTSLPGARILGVHVEGPFLAEARRGAHDASLFCDPTPERVEALLEPGTMALLTLAAGAAGRAGGDRAARPRGRAGQRRPQRRGGGGGGRGDRGGGADGHARLQRSARDPSPRAGRRGHGAGRSALGVRADPRRPPRGRRRRPSGVRRRGRSGSRWSRTRSPPWGWSRAFTRWAGSR